jgi:hypothetical protein
MEAMRIILTAACETLYCGGAFVDDEQDTLRSVPHCAAIYGGAAYVEDSWDIVATKWNDEIAAGGRPRRMIVAQ